MTTIQDVEILIRDGSNLLARELCPLERLPLPGSSWTIDRTSLGDLADRFLPDGIVVLVALPDGGPAKVEVETVSARAPQDRIIVALNENRIPGDLRDRAALALLAHPVAPSVTWRSSGEARTVLGIAGPESVRLAPDELEALLDTALIGSSSVG